MVDPEDIQLTIARAGDADNWTIEEEIAGLLENAAGILRRHPRGERDDSVAWRVADAGLLLRSLMETPKRGWSKVPGVQGVNCPTGMGAMLPPKVYREAKQDSEGRA
jgi:hypothetical protein